MPVSLERSYAHSLDIADPLARQRNKFHLPITIGGNTQVYFCGHSLGLQPKHTASLLNEELLAWQHQAVEGHFASTRPWLSYHEQVAPGLAQLCGASPTEVVAMNSLTVNLHLMLVSFYRPTQQRYKVLIEAQAFPSDRYAARSQIEWHGFDANTGLIEATPREGEQTLRSEDLVALIEQHGDDLALVLLPGVQYLTGQLFDMAAITRAAQAKGCVVGFDLAHAIGNVSLKLHDWNADFAVWCSYKYLNSGPGSIGGCFVHERHANNFSLPRFAGWWGHDKGTRFAMPDVFRPSPGAEGWQLSNPPILACAPLLASLQVFASTDMQVLRTKSLQMTGYLEQLLHALLGERITVITPSDATARGAQLSVRLNASRELARQWHEQLQARGFICDWREPDILRIAPAPLYTRYVDVWELVSTMQSLLNG
jgi:kynureninase